MTRKKKTIRDLDSKQRALLFNNSISADIVAMLLYMRPSEITDIRYRSKYKDSINEASKRYRSRIREAELEKFKKPYGSHNLWSKEEEALLLDLYFSGVTDKDIAAKLNRSTYSVAKKRERILRDVHYEQNLKTTETSAPSTGLING